MHRVDFAVEDKNISFECDDNCSYIVLKVLGIFGYKLNNTVEKPYSSVSRVYIMHKASDVKELKDNGRKKSVKFKKRKESK